MNWTEVFKPFVMAHKDAVTIWLMLSFTVFWALSGVYLAFSAWRDWMKTRMVYLEWLDKRKVRAGEGTK